jgi:predicted CopG family antitoxin
MPGCNRNTTTVEVSNDNHQRLMLRKRSGESFNDVVERLLDKTQAEPDSPRQRVQ